MSYERDPQYLRDWKQKRLDAGLCVTCGKNPPREGRQTCQNCADKISIYQKRRVTERYSRGVCQRCESTNLEFIESSGRFKKFCPDCLQIIKERKLKSKM